MSQFTPEIVRTSLGSRLTETAPSSGYGKITAAPSPKREAERPTFKPEIKSSKTGERLRESGQQHKRKKNNNKKKLKGKRRKKDEREEKKYWKEKVIRRKKRKISASEFPF